jgi:hypothetical protein
MSTNATARKKIPKPSKLKSPPTKVPSLKAALTDALPTTGGTSTLDRVIRVIESFTSDPVEPEDEVGDLVKNLIFLGRALDTEFDLQGQQQYWPGEIESQWTVNYLAGYTALKMKATP